MRLLSYSLGANQSPAGTRDRGSSFRPRLEALEERSVPSVLLQDDFNDNSLDPQKWQIALPPIPGTPGVVEQNQHIELRDSGHLRTTEQFDPLSSGPLTISGICTFASSQIAFQQEDLLTIATRTSGAFDGTIYGGLRDGINFRVTMGQDNPSQMWIADNFTGSQPAPGVRLDLRNGDTFSFIVTDDGLHLTFSVTSPRSGTTTITGQSSSHSGVDYIVFHNGQRGANLVPHVSYLDDITVTDSAQDDIHMLSASLQSGNSVQFAYETTGNPGPFDVGLYPSSDGVNYDTADQIGDLKTIIPDPDGGEGSDTIGLPSPWNFDASKPYIVVVADPPSAGKPKGNIIEFNDTDVVDNNNFASFLLPRIVTIDVKPGSDINPVDLTATGVLPVAVLSTLEFDATTVDVSSIQFGDVRDGFGKVAPVRASIEDVNGDGIADLLLHFSIPGIVSAGAMDADTAEVELLAIAPSGSLEIPIRGGDTVCIVPPAKTSVSSESTGHFSVLLAPEGNSKNSGVPAFALAPVNRSLGESFFEEGDLFPPSVLKE